MLKKTLSKTWRIICLVVSATRRRRNAVLSVYTRAEKLNAVSNDHRRTQKWDFSVLDRKIPFRGKFAPKIKIVSLSWNLVLTLIRMCRIRWWYLLFPFSIENTLFKQIWSKSSKYSKSLKWNLVPGLIQNTQVTTRIHREYAHKTLKQNLMDNLSNCLCD